MTNNKKHPIRSRIRNPEDDYDRELRVRAARLGTLVAKLKNELSEATPILVGYPSLIPAYTDLHKALDKAIGYYYEKTREK